MNKGADPRRRKQSRPKSEYFVRLDVRVLARGSMLKQGASGFVFLRATEGARSALIHVRAFEHHLELTHSGIPLGTQCSYSVNLERLPGRYGGHRQWFRCPRCGMRRAVLFGFAEDARFGCWGCMDLVYACQDERKMSRLWRQQAKLEGKLARGLQSPHGMYKRTYRSIHRKLMALRRKESRLFCDGARTLMRRQGWL